jgi:hypothetical protein
VANFVPYKSISEEAAVLVYVTVEIGPTLLAIRWLVYNPAYKLAHCN